MKVVKLNRTHTIFRYGYTHAIRFPRRTVQCNQLIAKIQEQFGKDDNKWCAYRARKDRPMWIGFKDEKVISFVLMLG